MQIAAIKATVLSEKQSAAGFRCLHVSLNEFDHFNHELSRFRAALVSCWKVTGVRRCFAYIENQHIHAQPYAMRSCATALALVAHRTNLGDWLSCSRLAFPDGPTHVNNTAIHTHMHACGIRPTSACGVRRSCNEPKGRL